MEMTEEISKKIENAIYDLRFLLNRGYKKKVAMDFVGNHYLLHEKHRNYLERTIFSEEKSSSRKSKIVPLSKIRGKILLVDGYNVLITVESILTSDKSIVPCDDGVLRDVNAVFGKYKLKEITEKALNSIISLIKIYRPQEVRFFYDSPVSFSGELARLTQQVLKKHNIPGRAETAGNVDYQIINQAQNMGAVVASSDGIIMDKVNQILDLPCFMYQINKKHLTLT